MRRRRTHESTSERGRAKVKEIERAQKGNLKKEEKARDRIPIVAGESRVSSFSKRKQMISEKKRKITERAKEG